jgi:hypothetical protein
VRIFIGFGYNDRDKWVRDLVIPLVGSFGAEVVTGEDLHGEIISAAVIQRIRQSDGLIAFLTRRGKVDDGTWTTHRWVTDELSAAIAAQKRVLEIRESGVDAQGGIAGDRQRVTYDEAQRDRCLVEIAKAVGAWSREVHLRLQLLPENMVAELRPFLKTAQCTFRFLTPDNEETPEKPGRIIPIKGGLFMDIRDGVADALVQVRIQANGWSWSSNYESTDSVGIQLSKE